MKRATRNTTSVAPTNNRAYRTLGQLFPDGHAIELLRDTADPAQLKLLYWNCGRGTVKSSVERNGSVYRVPELAPSLLQALLLPGGYSFRKSTAPELFRDIADAFEEKLKVPRENAERFSFFCMSTWFLELLPSAPSLIISGPDLSQGINALRLLGCMCRRPLVLAGLSPAGWRSLPSLHPTLLMFNPTLSPKMKELWSASSQHGFYVPGQGDVRDLFCAKAIYSNVDIALPWTAAAAIRVALMPSPADAQILQDGQLDQLARELQPRLLTYRLTTYEKVRESRFDVPEFTFPMRALARTLGMCVPDDRELAHRLISLLRPQDSEVRAERCTEPDSVLIEVLLGVVREACSVTGERKSKSSAVAVKEVRDLFNVLLRSRGDCREYSPEEVGWMLRRLGLSRIRGAAGMKLCLSAQTSDRVHKLARMCDVLSLKTVGKDYRECAEEQLRPGV